jgi:hypothetical protein
MARKLYKTINKITSFSIGLVIKGKDGKKDEKKHVHFNGGITHPRFSPSTHTEGDEKWQKALEESPFHGKKYKLAATFDDVPKPVVIQPKKIEPKGPVEQPDNNVIKKVHQVTTLQGAITSLIKNGYDGDVDELTDLESIVLAAKSVNIEFTKLD